MAELITDLKTLKAKREAKEAQAELRNRPKAKWFTLAPKQTKTVQFLNELSKEADNYNEAHGTFLGALVHQAHGKDGFRSKALDTMEEEGRDYAQEMYEKYRDRGEDGWRPQEKFYINVAVKLPDGSVEAQILERNLYSMFVEDLTEIYDDSEGVGITGRTFTITRRGEGNQTVWKIKESSEELDISGVEPWVLTEYAVRKVPYAQQKEFYGRNYTPELEVLEDEGTENTSGEAGETDEDLDW